LRDWIKSKQSFSLTLNADHLLVLAMDEQLNAGIFLKVTKLEIWHHMRLNLFQFWDLCTAKVGPLHNKVKSKQGSRISPEWSPFR